MLRFWKNSAASFLDRLKTDAARALRAGLLIAEHKDPFDQMIAAQTLALDVAVLSPDPQLDQFGVRRVW